MRNVEVEVMKMECHECGRDCTAVRSDYDYSSVGLPVILENIEIVRCEACGHEEAMIPKMSKIHRLIALAVIQKPYRLTGAEVRYLRKWLGMSAADFAAPLKVDKTTVSKWENDALEIGEQSDRLIRTVVLGLGEGLSGELKDTVALFGKISEEIRPVKIRMNPDKMRYTYAA